MEWILDHLQLVIAIVIIAGYLLRGLKKSSDQEEPGAEEPAAHDSDAAERTRRIQEEIRRRILERQRGETPPQPRSVVVLDEPTPAPPQQHRFPRAEPRPVVPPPIPARAEPEQEIDAVLERQRELAEKLQALGASRSAVGGRPSAVWETPKAPAAVAAGSTFLWNLRRELHGPESLRKAILLKEILGEPVGLRPGFPKLPRR